MQGNWKKISSTQIRGQDKITITKSETLGFSQKMYEENGVEKYQYVTIFYSAPEKALGIHFVTNDAEGDKFKIIHRTKQKGASVKIRNFFQLENISAKKYRGHYDYTKEEMDGVGLLYVIRLKEREQG